MILATLAYVITTFLFVFIKNKRKEKFYSFPHLKIKKSGIVFYSNLRHRLKYCDSKIIQVGTNVYMRKTDKIVLIKNVDNIKINGEWLYFDALGECAIIFNAKNIYKFFNFNIVADKINFEKIKKITLNNVINNIFSLNLCKKLKIYLKFIKNVMKIEIKENEIRISKNNLKIPFIIVYKIRNKIRKVKVNETL